jgi:hypothetical protein
MLRGLLRLLSNNGAEANFGKCLPCPDRTIVSVSEFKMETIPFRLLEGWGNGRAKNYRAFLARRVIDFALLKKVMGGGSQRCDLKPMLTFWKDDS